MAELVVFVIGGLPAVPVRVGGLGMIPQGAPGRGDDAVASSSSKKLEVGNNCACYGVIMVSSDPRAHERERRGLTLLPRSQPPCIATGSRAWQHGIQ